MQRRFNDVIFHKTLKSAVVLVASNPYLKDKNYTTVNLDFTLYVRSYSTQGTVTVSPRYGHDQSLGTVFTLNAFVALKALFILL